MKLSDLIEALGERYPLQSVGSTELDTMISAVRILSEDEEASDESVLYIGSCSVAQPREEMLLALICDGTPPKLPRGSAVYTCATKDIPALVNLAQELLQKELRSEAAFLDFSLEAARSSDLQHMIDYAAELMGNAIILVDIANRVLAVSSTPPIMDPLWAENVEQGNLENYFVQKVRSDPDMRTWHKTDDEMRIITLEGDVQPKLVTRISFGDRIVGGAIMIAHHTPIGKQHRQFSLVAKELLEIYLRNQSALIGEPQDSIYGQALFALLDNRTEAKQLVSQAFEDINLPASMRVVAARFNDRNENSFVKRSLSSDLRLIFPEDLSVVYRSYVGILTGAISDNQRVALEELAQAEQVTIGISWPFTDIMQFGRHFREASDIVKLLEQAPQDKRVDEFTGQAPISLLQHYTGTMPLDFYRHPALDTLLHYDKIKHTSFYDTLHAYIRCDRNVTHTADTLFIHRNTLLYRLRRMEELTQLDFSETETFIALYLAFLIDGMKRT